MEPFFARALAAGLALAVVAAPLGCFVVWRRMAYFGETLAQASLIGVALGLAAQMDLTVSVLLAVLAMAGLLIALQRQTIVPVDSLLGTMHYVALALGIIATATLVGPTVNVVGYLFGDVLAVSDGDLVVTYLGGLLVLAALWRLWTPLLRMSVHADLAAAEGVATERVRLAFTLLLALAIAGSIKVVGALLAIAFLIIPAVAARPIARTPEAMAVLAALIGAASVVAGLYLSASYDVPSGPAIIVVMATVAFASLGTVALAPR
jgi:zinc transport system permease protein